MKEFDLVYDPRDEVSLCLFNHLDIQNLMEPITIQRDEPLPEEIQQFQKKKSEVVEHEDEEYLQLKEEEQEPIIVTDGESKTYAGKLQDISSNNGVYFAMINTGRVLKLMPIKKWYRFVQRNQFGDGDVEILENKVKINEIENESIESEKEVDYEEEFDDDDGEENGIIIEEKKRLTNAGEKLKSIVENIEETGQKKINNEKIDEGQEETTKKIKIESAVLTKEEIQSIIGNESISAKELLKRISGQYLIKEYEKNLIREFIHEKCMLVEDPNTGERLFRLKKTKKN